MTTNPHPICIPRGHLTTLVGLLASALLLFTLNCGGGDKNTINVNTGTGGARGAGGSSGTQCGGPGQPCCGGNACNGGGCCVATTTGAQTTRLCVGAGQACVATGVTGTCTSGSCSGPTGSPCGALAQTCCGINPDAGANAAGGFCTAGGTRCVVGTCSACGGPGQACCQ